MKSAEASLDSRRGATKKAYEKPRIIYSEHAGEAMPADVDLGQRLGRHRLDRVAPQSHDPADRPAAARVGHKAGIYNARSGPGPPRRLGDQPMKTAQRPPTTIDEYIAGFPRPVQAILKQIRSTIRRAAPDAGEAIKYRVPTFVLNGNLVHFAAFKNHIGFYPTPSGIQEFSDELSRYESAKGSVQFPIDEPMPLSLIGRIVKFRVREARAMSKPRPR